MPGQLKFNSYKYWLKVNKFESITQTSVQYEHEGCKALTIQTGFVIGTNHPLVRYCHFGISPVNYSSILVEQR